MAGGSYSSTDPMLRQAISTVNKHVIRRPVAAAVLAATTKNVTGDLIIQKVKSP